MRVPTHGARSGLTLVELIIASFLASILMGAVFRLLDVSLDLWSKGETRRNVVEQTTAVAELFSRDIAALHNGQQGDLLVEWVTFDADGDDKVDRAWPRLRFVRQASAADIARLEAQAIPDEILNEALATGVPLDELAGELYDSLPDDGGLLEVVWVILPAGGDDHSRYEGVIWRGENWLAPDAESSFLAGNFFDGTGRAPVGALNEVTGGVLWFGLQFAAQTSIVWDGWRLGHELRDTTACWDAWNRDRPDLDVHTWNDLHEGMPAVDDRPLLPRRVRLELEFERPRDLERRTTLVDALDSQMASFEVANGERLPRRAGSHILIGSEWMEISSLRGDRVQVKRGARATRAIPHAPGEKVRFGTPLVIEVPVALYSDDWNLK